MSLPGSFFICPTCSKSYKRREHLQRHSNIHLANRPYRCRICEATFARTDLLRRHSQTCRGSLETATSSHRRRACDRCARQKKACTLGQPCQGCLSKGTPCRYSTTVAGYTQDEPNLIERLAEESWELFETSIHRPGDPTGNTHMIAPTNSDTTLVQDLDLFLQGTLPDFPTTKSGNDTLDWLNFLGVSSNSLSAEGNRINKGDDSRQFRFLYNFTSRTGLSSTFECGTVVQRQNMLDALCGNQNEAYTIEVVGDAGSTVFGQTESPNSWLFDPLITRIHDIVIRLKEVVMSKPRNSAITQLWTPALEEQCLQFFTPSNIRAYLTSYWAIWHPNVNFVHKPTFDPVKAKSSLLASMTVIGT